ncbi:MAG: sulfotransferase family protein [Acidimicrobiales bacterium]
MSLPSVCPDPVFIIGSPRSGTTALAHALGRHPQLRVSKESYFVHQLFGNGRARAVWQHNQDRVTPSWLRHEGVERAEFLAYLGLGINALYTSRSGGRRWVDQTPLYTRMVDDLADMFPGAQFLHIVRDGRAVVRSMGRFDDVFDDEQRAAITDEIPAWADDFRAACETWSEWVETALRFASAHPDRCLTIANEDLASDPAGGFDKVFAFLRLDADAGPAKAFAGPRVNSSFKRAPSRPPDGWDDWDDEQRRVFMEVAGGTMARAGYTVSE